MHNNDRARCALLTSSHPVAARTREALERESKRERERERETPIEDARCERI